MSSNERLIDGGSDVATSDQEELALRELSSFDARDLTIESPDGDITLEPPVVTRVNGILPWNNAVDHGPCGETQVSQNGDRNWRVTVEGLVFFRHLSILKQLENEGDEVLVLTPMTVELGMERVAFDRIEMERREDLNDQRISFQGEVLDEPIYEFQFQKKQNSSDETDIDLPDADLPDLDGDDDDDDDLLDPI